MLILLENSTPAPRIFYYLYCFEIQTINQNLIERAHYRYVHRWIVIEIFSSLLSRSFQTKWQKRKRKFSKRQQKNHPRIILDREKRKIVFMITNSLRNEQKICKWKMRSAVQYVRKMKHGITYNVLSFILLNWFFLQLT